jgi:hypothetical protein
MADASARASDAYDGDLRVCEEGSIRFVWISGTNPAVSLPELARIRRTRLGVACYDPQDRVRHARPSPGSRYDHQSSPCLTAGRSRRTSRGQVKRLSDDDRVD